MLSTLDIGLGTITTLVFALAILHALGDFAFQNSFISRSKVPGADLSEFFGAMTPTEGIWLHSLTAHSLIHAGGVWLITGSVTFGIVEFVLHQIIDLLKGWKLIGFHTDQILHLGCKLAYAITIGSGLA